MTGGPGGAGNRLPAAAEEVAWKGDGGGPPAGSLPLVVYYCYGGTHASVVSAALHLGLLDPRRPPETAELLRLDFFDRNEREEHGRLLPMGHGSGADGVFVLGAEGAGDALARWCLGLLALAGDPHRWLFVNVLSEVNLAMKVAGFVSRRLGWPRLARPLLIQGVRAAFPHLVRRVEGARRAAARGQAGILYPGHHPATAPGRRHDGVAGPAGRSPGPPAGPGRAVDPAPAGPGDRAVFYVAGGTAHRALLAAYLHLGRLDPRRAPRPGEVAGLPLLAVPEAAEAGRIFRVGTDSCGRQVLAAGAGGPDDLAVRAAGSLRALGYLGGRGAPQPPGALDQGPLPAWRFVPVGDSLAWWEKPWLARPAEAGFDGGTPPVRGGKPRPEPPGTAGGGWRWRWQVRAWTRRWHRLAELVESARRAP
ncbi:DUF3189 family protein [Thermaerobacter subterraneus]|uniref:DUF3189 family protein n=1 Tax=Thermaerobacter subterraneus DSM 13965 TaxID=867903 RepID=K6PZ87_9FIRM|nr:DUF3189 family protein [Thermaerobacter subterraneus]EKP93894.1 Protein of unknown function (DUF3189) [Thermaerobacter subterraneus DSM 13965]